MKKQMIIISGQPGTGKTSIGQYFAEYLDIAFFDKDIICDDFTFFLMNTLFGKSNDKDSDLYKNNVRDIEYKTLMNIMTAQINLNLSFVAVAPFTSEVLDNNNYFNEIKENAALREYDVYFIHLTVDEEELKERITKRNKPEDVLKLENWELYKKRFAQNNLHSDVKTFVNTNIDDTIEDIINYIN